MEDGRQACGWTTEEIGKLRELFPSPERQREDVLDPSPYKPEFTPRQEALRVTFGVLLLVFIGLPIFVLVFIILGSILGFGLVTFIVVSLTIIGLIS